ncbi:DUF58 domain-containing protein [Alteromonas lipolytica]|uniref:DUF58 domain-containing protein n=1 Tax=Alteromonas lipolytica TaxID=1856405 RepID=A0A1E8FJ96_9ALTE|nr:DUF58 domain-containing protein [Alteromonas lipolytica]OFI35994.1 hypothetical protein BFC17_09965 [Alteromonas lipolytica]GGF71847.1 hypothetical protein GCM10011338_25100 [Alteromonas lipolytica]
MTTQSLLARLQSDGIHLGVKELLQYRQFANLLDLTPRRTPQARLAGSYLTKHKGRGMEFDEARHYQPGDDIRAIDWRVTARTGKTHTKVYREERERPVFILCDLSRSMQFGTQLLLKSVQAAHLTALISWAAAQRGDKVGALVYSDALHAECKPLSRKRAVLSICHELMRCQNDTQQHNTPPEAQVNMESALARLRRLAKPGSLVYIISDFLQLDERALQHLQHISRHCEVSALAVTDPLERELPVTSRLQQVNVTNGTQQQTWLLGDRRLASHYSSSQQARWQAVESHLNKCKTALSFIDAGLPLFDQFERLRRLSQWTR